MDETSLEGTPIAIKLLVCRLTMRSDAKWKHVSILIRFLVLSLNHLPIKIVSYAYWKREILCPKLGIVIPLNIALLVASSKATLRLSVAIIKEKGRGISLSHSFFQEELLGWGTINEH